MCRRRACSLNLGRSHLERADLPGFSTAVESYEYSKQPMNNVSFESGAGPSLAYGAVMNPSGATGATACVSSPS